MKKIAAVQVEVEGENAEEVIAKLSDRLAAMCDDPNTDLGQAKQAGATIVMASGRIENDWFGKRMVTKDNDMTDDGMRMDAAFFSMPFHF